MEGKIEEVTEKRLGEKIGKINNIIDEQVKLEKRNNVVI